MYIFIKRLIDLLASCFGMLLIAPFFVCLMLLLRFTGEKEVFYRQKRIGYKNKEFFILKFATMLKDSPQMGNKTVTLRNDPRITKVGKFLRITKVNEFPQILNDIKGDMGLVGPRPLLDTSFAKYDESVQKCLYHVRPGITGIGSLVFRDEEAFVTEVKRLGAEPLDYYRDWIYPYKGELETWYAVNRSIRVDLFALILTFVKLAAPNSDLVYKCFPDLPKKPNQLTIEGIRLLYS